MKYFLLLSTCLLLQRLPAQITRQWTAYFNGTGDFNDRFTCATHDAAGNFLLGGSVTNPDADRDFLVRKLGSNGAVLWTWMYNGPGSGSDEIRAIATDPAGNVYVTGLSQGENTDMDYLTVKLTPGGDTLWTRRYDFIGEYDQPNALFVDQEGNVLVTGQSDSDPSPLTNNDYATLKYTPNGDQLWIKRYNGLGDATDEAVAVVADAAGNIFVTGRTSNGVNDDYGTLSYTPGGGLQWFRFDDRGGRDRATAMTIDGNNNLIITGRSSNGDNDDFWTLKCTADGQLLWDAAYDFLDQDRPVAVTTDPTGNIVVTGQSDKSLVPPTDWDFLTVAYLPNGTQLWAKRYDGGLATDDIPAAVGTNSSGDVYVTGVSDVNPTASISNQLVTIRYNIGTGQQVWVKTIATTGNSDQAGNAVIALPDGCLIAGYSEDTNGRRDAVAYRFDTAGAQNWQDTFNGTGDNNDNVRALTVDALGNVFAAGYSTGGSNNRDMALVQFDQGGVLLCSHTQEGTAPGGADDAAGIALDASGNAIVAGVLKNSGSSNDIALQKTNTLCDTLWTRIVNGPGNGSDRVYDLVRDAAGALYITGRVDTDPASTANDDCFTAKFSSDGVLLWSKTYNSGGANADRGVVLRMGPAGDLYVAGRSWDGLQYDIFLLKYNNAGQQQWVKTWNGGGNDEPRDLAIDNAGNPVLCGTANQSAGDTLNDFITLKFNPAGNLLWEKRYDGAGAGNDRAEALAIDQQGYVLVAGRSDVDYTSALNEAAVLLKYAPNGDLQWGVTLNDKGNDALDDVALGEGDLIYLTGHFAHDANQPNRYAIATYIYSPAGEYLWSDLLDAPVGGSNVPNFLYLDGSDFYVAGSSNQGLQQRDMLVIKYSGMLVGAIAPSDRAYVRVYPNPFFRELRVELPEIPAAGAVFTLFDALGRIVFQENLQAAQQHFTLPDLPPGLCYYRITADQQTLAAGKLSHW